MEMDHSRRKRRRLQATSTTTSLEDLPEHVIQHIQSFLSHKEALSSSLVCKRWLHAWSTFPALFFRLQRIESAKDFFKFVDKTLERYLHENLIVEKLNLSLDFSLEEDDIFTLDSFQDSFDDPLAKWLQVAGQIGLKELALSLPEKPIKGMKKKFSVDKSPRLLSLNIPKINFHSLRIFELLNVCLDQQVIHQLLSGSNFPMLEKVDILYCKGFKRIKVDNLSSLVEFKLISFPSVTTVDIVDCPRLSSFEHMVLNSPWPQWEFNIDSSSFTNLRSLTCSNMDIDGKFFNKIISKFPCLEKLYMKSLNFLCDDIDVSSASLVELSLLDCFCIDEVELHAPKLCLLEYSDVGLPLWKNFDDPDMKTCKDQLKTKLLFRWQCVPDTDFFFKLLLFIETSNKIDIKVEPDIAVGFLDGFLFDIDFHLLRSDIPHPRENVEEVSFNTTGFPKDDTSAILDAFFTICRPKYLELRMLTADGHSKEIIEFFATPSICWCTTADDGQTTKKCWRHCLHEVEIEFIQKEYGEKQWLWLPFPSRLELLLYVVESAQTIRFRLKWSPYGKQ